MVSLLASSASSQNSKSTIIYALTADVNPEALEKIAKYPFAGVFSQFGASEVKVVL